MPGPWGRLRCAGALAGHPDGMPGPACWAAPGTSSAPCRRPTYPLPSPAPRCCSGARRVCGLCCPTAGHQLPRRRHAAAAGTAPGATAPLLPQAAGAATPAGSLTPLAAATSAADPLSAEVLTGQQVTVAADIYSLGIVLWEVRPSAARLPALPAAGPPPASPAPLQPSRALLGPGPCAALLSACLTPALLSPSLLRCTPHHAPTGRDRRDPHPRHHAQPARDRGVPAGGCRGGIAGQRRRAAARCRASDRTRHSLLVCPHVHPACHPCLTYPTHPVTHPPSPTLSPTHPPDPTGDSGPDRPLHQPGPLPAPHRQADCAAAGGDGVRHAQPRRREPSDVPWPPGASCRRKQAQPPAGRRV